MLGLKIFVRVQTFQRRSFVPSHHFCNPAITKYYKVASAHLESKNVLFWACARLFVAIELVWLQMQDNIPRLLWGVWNTRQFYSIKSVRRDLEILLRCINDENMVYGIIYGFQKKQWYQEDTAQSFTSLQFKHINVTQHVFTTVAQCKSSWSIK